MRAVALGLLGLLGLLGCQRAPYDLDMPIAIETDSLAALAALRAGIAELGGHVTDSAGQKVQVSSVCRCAGATAPHASVAACTVSGVIYLCQPSQMCSRCVKHELGHVFGVAKHSLDNRDLLYAIPAVEGFSDADKRAICKTGYVSGGVCD